MSWAMLGNVPVDLTDFVADWNEEQSAVYAEIQRIDRKPLLHRMGDALTSQSLTVRFNAAVCSVEDKIAAVEKLKDDGKVFPFVLGNGKYIGDFILDKITKSVISTEADGTLVAVDLTLSLLECPEQEEIAYITEGECSNDRLDLTDEEPPEPAAATEE